jgi:hypothetical protein
LAQVEFPIYLHALEHGVAVERGFTEASQIRELSFGEVCTTLERALAEIPNIFELAPSEVNPMREACCYESGLTFEGGIAERSLAKDNVLEVYGFRESCSLEMHLALEDSTAEVSVVWERRPTEICLLKARTIIQVMWYSS